MYPISLVVFDMAGTTIKDDNEVLKCFNQAAANNGLKATEARVNQMMGLPKRKVFEVLWQEQIGEYDPDYAQKVATTYQDFKAILEDYYRREPILPTVGCLELFEWLTTQGIKIALNTGFYREVTNIILNRLGWDLGLNADYVGSESSIIQVSVTPSEIYNNEGRPAPYLIQKAMYKLGVTNPQEVIAVGDTPSDLAAGKNAHCLMTLGVTSGTHSYEELVSYPHDRLIKSLLELKEIIND
ncbi:MAG: HAD family hydrolase [Gloeocapsa sp. DLM2.Bin57]|nr:MAG: HAD family hydrolase [Gloeocapsa sp. DLM2.Bin57]